jgi:hypothetical protein
MQVQLPDRWLVIAEEVHRKWVPREVGKAIFPEVKALREAGLLLTALRRNGATQRMELLAKRAKGAKGAPRS